MRKRNLWEEEENKDDEKNITVDDEIYRPSKYIEQFIFRPFTVFKARRNISDILKFKIKNMS